MKMRYFCGFCLGVFLLAVLPCPVSCEPVQAPGHESPILPEDLDYAWIGSVKIVGDRVAWQGLSPVQDTVCFYDLAEERYECVGDSKHSYFGDIDDTTVAIWYHLSGQGHVVLHDIATGVKTVVRQDENYERKLANPVISGDYLIWQERDDPGDDFDIFCYQISTGALQCICNNASEQNFPSIAGNQVVWQDMRNGNADIYLYDLSIGEQRALCTDPAAQEFPRIDGNSVVWTDTRNGNEDIYLYDLTTGEEIRITDDPAPQRSPSVSGDLVVWEDYRNGNGDIYLYDRSTGEEWIVCSSPDEQSAPWISGNRIVWADNRLGPMSEKVYVFTLDEQSPADGPDLVISDIRWSPANPKPGDALIFSAVITNMGSEDSPDGVTHGVLFKIDAGTDAYQGVWSDHLDASIAPGESVTVTANGGYKGALWTATDGVHTVRAIVDDLDRIAEINEGNNVRSETLPVGTGTDSDPDGVPDLMVEGISCIPMDPKPGENVRFEVRIKNVGTGSTPAGVIHGVLFQIDAGTGSYKGVWSDYWSASLAPGQAVTLTANGGFNGATWMATAGSHTIQATVDDIDRISEGNEKNNGFSKKLVVDGSRAGTSGADLVVTDISWAPASPGAGDPVTFSATVKNQGSEATPSGVTHGLLFRIDAGTGSYKGVWSDSSTASIAPGASVTLTANGGSKGATWTVTAGSHTVQAIVDDVNRIAESNEGNNAKTETLTVGSSPPPPSGSPDLVVTDISWTPGSPGAGDAVTFSATVKNLGAGATPSGVVHGVLFRIDNGGSPGVWSDSYTGSIAPGASVTLTASGGSNGATWTATAGSHTVEAVVDDMNRIAESNEGNNALTETVTVGSSPPPPSGLPDLVVTGISWTPGTPGVGDAVTFSATVKNQGAGATPSGVVHGLLFRIDGGASPGVWSDSYTGSIAPGASVTLTANGGSKGATWPATAGLHTVQAIADDVNRIAEINEGNNAKTGTVVV
jgi:beta propeller repeat protein